MSFAFQVAGFLATTNAGRVALARRAALPSRRSMALALLAGAALIGVCTLVAGDLLDALDISPESFRIAAGLVLVATGVPTLVAPSSWSGPFAAVLITPELTCLAVSFGADEPTVEVLGAAAVAVVVVAITALVRPREPLVLATRFLAALQLVVAVALAVAGVRDV